MDEDVERWAQEQESLPEHLQRWYVFEHPRRIWLAKIAFRAGLNRLGKRLCGMRFETDEERADRLREYWEQEKKVPNVRKIDPKDQP